MTVRKSISVYHQPAGGWGALKAVAEALDEQGIAVKGTTSLLRMNQPEGFDCPAARGRILSIRHPSSFAKTVRRRSRGEATAKRCTPEFFAAHTVTELDTWSDYDLEMVGRVTHPMVYDAASDHYKPISWDGAFTIIGRHLNGLSNPNAADFYTSGRASNEAAFLFQLFAREYGTNNFPDCSNMCHEATSVGLPESLGVGKGTVLLEDFDSTDAIFIFGQNPGTNSPRMMTTLRDASRRGVSIISFNPFRERSLERFQAPQSPIEMVTLTSTPISESLYQVRVGGDVAVLKGLMKAMIEADDAAIAADAPRVVDVDFINGHTKGFDALATDLRAASWTAIERKSGLSRAQICSAAMVYMNAPTAILVFGMGIHPASLWHSRGSADCQSRDVARQCWDDRVLVFARFAGTRMCRGIVPSASPKKPTAEFLSRLEKRFGFKPPSAHGHDVVTALEAMIRGESKVFIALGGNFAAAVPDWIQTRGALRKLDLTVQISTKLNRSHMVHGREAIILPCLGRSEIDVQANGPQAVTVEDSMSMVHASRGMNVPVSEHLRSEPAIIAGMARATLGPGSKVAWEDMIADYDQIRLGIEAVFPIFKPIMIGSEFPEASILPPPPANEFG